MDQMTVIWVYNGDPKHIPAIGEQLEMKPHLYFVVEAYGESRESKTYDHKIPSGQYGRGRKITPLYELELLGHILIPKGSPMEVLERLLDGSELDPQMYVNRKS